MHPSPSLIPIYECAGPKLITTDYFLRALELNFFGIGKRCLDIFTSSYSFEIYRKPKTIKIKKHNYYFLMIYNKEFVFVKTHYLVE